MYMRAGTCVKIDRTRMADEKRPYRKKRRAELEAETRMRITESAMELHGTLGPSRTSMSAVAERAGVRRSTLYRHFPDEQALFNACSSHWAALNPSPDIEAWVSIEDPDERLRTALEEMYGFYRRTRQMMENLHRDEATMPTVTKTFVGYREYMSAACAIVLRGRGRAPQRVRAAVGHALSFPTWRSLAIDQGLDDSKAADLMCRLVLAAR
jgi:AcrR family transcriptional regulator